MEVRRDYETALAPALRRVEGVRVYLGDGCLRAEVYGKGHRLPARLPVSTKLATRLVEAGAPLEIIQVGTAPADKAPADRAPADQMPADRVGGR